MAFYVSLLSPYNLAQTKLDFILLLIIEPLGVVQISY